MQFRTTTTSFLSSLLCAATLMLTWAGCGAPEPKPYLASIRFDGPIAELHRGGFLATPPPSQYDILKKLEELKDPTGKQLAEWADDVQVMSGGDITVEMFYSSSVVATVETFDAAINGIIDCDATGGAYQTGKNPAFQFVGDIMGGYDTPWQQLFVAPTTATAIRPRRICTTPRTCS